MHLAVIATVFPIIFVAELPDKTALASLVMGTRYRASWVFTGVTAAFAAHVALAVAVGALLSLLPHRILAAVAAAVFPLGAVLLRGRHEESLAESHDKVGFWRVAATWFTVILVAEFGGLTQIVTANVAAKYHDPISVGIGSVIGLWAVGGRRACHPGWAGAVAVRTDEMDHPSRCCDHGRAGGDQPGRRDPRLAHPSRRASSLPCW